VKTRLTIILLSVVCSIAYGQPTRHPWHVVDRGGGKSTGNGFNLQGSIGQPSAQEMTGTGFQHEGGYIPGIRSLSGVTTSLELALEDGWNMVSVPLLVSDYRKITLYPTATSKAFAYSGSYQERDTLRNGVGYWLKYASSTSQQIIGSSFARETINVTNGWNMIGTPSYPVRIVDIIALSPTTLASNYFGYASASGYYTEDTLREGKAYWIKVNNTGSLDLPTGSVLIEPTISHALIVNQLHKSPSQTQRNTLTFRDNKGRERVLYFSAANIDLDIRGYELPPSPPAELFDVRFATNRSVTVADKEKTTETTIHISAAEYPLTISWNCKENATLILDGKELNTKVFGEAKIEQLISNIRLRLFPASSRELPKEFALHQNFPNPFNPSSTIRYDLPASVHVKLTIYNMLGQEVATLVDDIEDAGFKSVEWNASDVSSGVYFYRLLAGNFIDVRKTLVIK